MQSSGMDTADQRAGFQRKRSAGRMHQPDVLPSPAVASRSCWYGAGMTARKAPLTPPAALTATEPNAFVARIMSSLAGKWSVTKMDTLFESSRLAWHLHALGRDELALALCTEVTGAVAFDGNFNIWTPVAAMLCTGARLARLRGDEAKRAAFIGRIVEHPAFAEMPRDRFDAWLAIDGDIAQGVAETSKKWACHRLAGALTTDGYFRETAGAGFYYDAWVDVGARDKRIASTFSALRERLEARGR